MDGALSTSVFLFGDRLSDRRLGRRLKNFFARFGTLGPPAARGAHKPGTSWAEKNANRRRRRRRPKVQCRGDQRSSPTGGGGETRIWHTRTKAEWGGESTSWGGSVLDSDESVSSALAHIGPQKHARGREVDRTTSREANMRAGNTFFFSSPLATHATCTCACAHIHTHIHAHTHARARALAQRADRRWREASAVV